MPQELARAGITDMAGANRYLEQIFVAPNIASVLMRTTEVSSAQKTNEVKRDADLCLRPPIDKYGVLEFESIDQIVEAGYRYTQRRLEELRTTASLTRFLGTSLVS